MDGLPFTTENSLEHNAYIMFRPQSNALALQSLRPPSAAYTQGTTPTLGTYGNAKCVYLRPHIQMLTVSPLADSAGLLCESMHVAALAVPSLLEVQAVLYLQHNSNLLEKGTELGEQDLLAFSNIRVSIHHVITDRIDHLRPSQQLTLKVGLFSLHCISIHATRATNRGKGDRGCMSKPMFMTTIIMTTGTWAQPYMLCCQWQM